MSVVRAGTFSLVLFLLAVCVAPTASAFGLSGIGGKIGFLDPEGASGTLTLGGHMEFEESGSRLHLLPGLMWWDKNGVTDVNPNFDVYYHFNPEGTMTPYLGGGVGFHFYDIEGVDEGESDLGMNVFGGLRFPSNRTRFFVEGRYAITDLSQLSVLGGVTFHLSD